MLPSSARHRLLVLAVDLWLKELAGDCRSEAVLGLGGLAHSGGTELPGASVVIRWHGEGPEIRPEVRVPVDDVLASSQCVEISAERIASDIAREHLSDGHRP